MSETLHSNPNEQLLNDVRAAIAPDMAEFEQLAQNDIVQAFCNYNERFMRPRNFDNINSFLAGMKEVPEPRTLTSEEVAAQLTHANDRLDEFTQGLISSYCGRKKQALPENDADKNTLLAKILSGGYSKVSEYMIWSNAEGSTGIDTPEQKVFLPLTFVMLGAHLRASHYYDRIDNSLEPNAPQEEIDAAIDQAMQAACAAIQENKKITVPKNASDAEKAFAASMNCLRTLHNMHEDRGFKEQLMLHYMYCFNVDGSTLEDLHTSYEKFRAFFSEVIDARYSQLDPRSAANIIYVIQKKTDKLYSDQNRLATAVGSSMDQITSIKSTHALVGSIAEGSVKYSQVKQALMLLNKQPLARPVSQVVTKHEDLDEWVNWEILPPDLLEEHEGLPQVDGQQDPYAHERQIDWRRLWRLQNYAKGWNGAYFARTSIPNLPLDKQYYAVILPDSINGQAVEHAVADHPETGNGMYVWRAEMGMDHASTRLTWREVMARPRMTARELGARCLYHTVNLETNLLAYLTDPKPERRRYSRQ